MSESSNLIHQDFIHYEATDQLDAAGLEMKLSIDHFPAIPLADGAKYFDNFSLFVPDASKPRTRYLYLSIGSVVNTTGFAKTPETMQIDTFFYIYFFADLYEPVRYVSYSEKYRKASSVLAMCGFDCRQARSGVRFFEIDQYQAALWGKRESTAREDFSLYYKDLGFLKWPNLATHVVEQLAYKNNQLKKNVAGVFILPEHMFERRRRKGEPTKAMGVAKQRGYQEFQLSSGEFLPAKRQWRPIESISVDSKFQSILQRIASSAF